MILRLISGNVLTDSQNCQEGLPRDTVWPQSICTEATRPSQL